MIDWLGRCGYWDFSNVNHSVIPYTYLRIEKAGENRYGKEGGKRKEKRKELEGNRRWWLVCVPIGRHFAKLFRAPSWKKGKEVDICRRATNVPWHHSQKKCMYLIYTKIETKENWRRKQRRIGVRWEKKLRHCRWFLRNRRKSEMKTNIPPGSMKIRYRSFFVENWGISKHPPKHMPYPICSSDL